MEEDSQDLANIFESISPNDVPPQMQIMWEIKKKTAVCTISERLPLVPKVYHIFYSISI